MPRKPTTKTTAPRTPQSQPDKASALIEAAARDYFLPYQRDWILDESPLKLYEKSRRIGITYATSYRVLRKCLRQPGLTQWVTSRDEKTAVEFVTEYMAKWCKLANVVAAGLDGTLTEVVDESKGIKAQVVKLGNGSRVMSLASTPQTFAGKGGDVLIDEMDLHEHQESLLAMAMPVAMWGGQVEIVSAYDPDGSTETEFAQLVADIKAGINPAKWTLHHTDIDEAIAAGLVEKINAVRACRVPPMPRLTREEFRTQERAKCRTERVWLSQYKCTAVNAAGFQAIKATDLAMAMVEYPIYRLHIEGNAGPRNVIDPSVQFELDGGLWDKVAALVPKGGRLGIGYDVARTGHLSAIPVNYNDGAMNRLLAMITLHNCKFTSQEKLIYDALTQFPGAVGAGDATGMGMNVCENLATKFGPERFLQVNFSATKHELGTLAIETFEKGRQMIPATPREIAADLAAIVHDISIKTKHATFGEIANRLNDLSHADMAWGLILSLYALARASRPTEWAPLGNRPEDILRTNHPLAQLEASWQHTGQGVVV